GHDGPLDARRSDLWSAHRRRVRVAVAAMSPRGVPHPAPVRRDDPLHSEEITHMPRHGFRFHRTLVTAIVLVLLLTGGPAARRAGAGPTLSRAQDPLIQNMDTTVKPGTDFFMYACGKWIKQNPIPASERGWGIGNLVQEETYTQRRA